MGDKVRLVAAVAFLVAGLLGGVGAQADRIMTFEDPAPDGDDYTFIIDMVGQTLVGGWDDSKQDLDLNLETVLGAGMIFEDAWFEMPTVNYAIGGLGSYEVDPGVINFYEDNAAPGSVPLVEIVFDGGYLWGGGFGAEPFLRSDAAVITVNHGGSTYIFGEDVSFGFGFTSQVYIPAVYMTASSAFTSSGGPIVPEPASVVLLLGGMGAWFYKRQ